MILLLLAAALIVGNLTPWQTAANGKLKERLRSPFLASFINCAVGSTALTAAMLLTGESFTRSFAVYAAIPWWQWLSGPLGAVILVVAVVLAPRLGLIGVALSTMTGMMVSGVIFDDLGLFKLPVHELDALRVLGLVLMLIGVCIVLKVFTFLKKHAQGFSLSAVFFFLLGCFSGTLMTAQAAINALFRVELGSVLLCALISMLSTALILIIAAPLAGHSPARLLHLKVEGKYWMFIGGLCGATYIIGNALLVPLLGAGTLMTLGIAGQLCASLLLDHFGLLEQKVRRINLSQIFGMLIIVAAVALIRL